MVELVQEAILVLETQEELVVKMVVVVVLGLIGYSIVHQDPITEVSVILSQLDTVAQLVEMVVLGPNNQEMAATAFWAGEAEEVARIIVPARALELVEKVETD